MAKNKKKPAPARSTRKVDPHKKGRKPSKGFKRYNFIQGELASHLKDKDIKLPRGMFAKQASEIYHRTKNEPQKYIRQNIEVLYEEYATKPEFEREFPDKIPFWDFVVVMEEPMFDGVYVKLNFSDDMIGSQQTDGYPTQVADWYQDHLYEHLRRNYDKSPAATMRKTDTDNKTYVTYSVDTDDAEITEELERAIIEREAEDKGEKIPDTKPTTDDKTIQLKIEQEKTKQKQAEVEKLKYVQSLMEKGLTFDQIQKLLGG